MTDYSPEARRLGGSVGAPAMASAPTGEVSFGHVLGVLRRRLRLIVVMIALGAGAGLFLAMQELPIYRAHSVLRLAGERRALTGSMEAPAPEVARNTDPILSLVELIRSRTVLGEVIDSLGLQLQSRTPEFPTSLLSHVVVDPYAVSDSVKLMFSEQGVAARYAGRQSNVVYGDVLSLGSTRFAIDRRPEVTEAMLEIMPRERAIDWLVGALAVSSRPETDLIDVNFSSTDPKLAQQVVNRTVQIFQEFNIQSSRAQSRRRRIVLEEQLAQTDSTLALAQSQLAAFQSHQQIGSSESQLAAEQTALLALGAQRAELELDRSTYSALQRRLQGSGADRDEALRALASSPSVRNNPQVASYYQRLSAYQFRLDSMTTGPGAATATNPDVVTLKNLIASTQKELVHAVGAHLDGIDAQINSLGAMGQRSGRSIEALPAVVAEEMRLTSRVDALGRVGEQLRQDYQRARMAEAVEAGDVEIIDLADVPYAPLSSAGFIKVTLGVVLGLLLGGCLAFLLEALNTAIRRPEDIESLLHVPGLAVIPRLTASPGGGRPRLGSGAKGPKGRIAARNAAAHIGTETEPFSLGIEAFRMLRTSLVWSDGAGQLRTLVVTSAAPGEGKTLTAANLAVSFAHDGLEVLLVDCDIRRPRLHGLFRERRSPGLLDLLAPPNGDGGESVGSLSLGGSGDPLAHVLRPTPIRGLTLLTCGTLPTNASNLLSGVRMQSLLNEAKHRFGLVILDTPPVLATADAGILGKLADGVLMVVRAGQTDRAAAQRAYQQLQNVGAHVVGAVLNDPKGELSEYGDYYYPYEYEPEKG